MPTRTASPGYGSFHKSGWSEGAYPESSQITNPRGATDTDALASLPSDDTMWGAEPWYGICPHCSDVLVALCPYCCTTAPVNLESRGGQATGQEEGGSDDSGNVHRQEYIENNRTPYPIYDAEELEELQRKRQCAAEQADRAVRLAAVAVAAEKEWHAHQLDAASNGPTNRTGDGRKPAFKGTTRMPSLAQRKKAARDAAAAEHDAHWNASTAHWSRAPKRTSSSQGAPRTRETEAGGGSIAGTEESVDGGKLEGDGVDTVVDLEAEEPAAEEPGEEGAVEPAPSTASTTDASPEIRPKEAQMTLTEAAATDEGMRAMPRMENDDNPDKLTPRDLAGELSSPVLSPNDAHGAAVRVPDDSRISPTMATQLPTKGTPTTTNQMPDVHDGAGPCDAADTPSASSTAVDRPSDTHQSVPGVSSTEASAQSSKSRQRSPDDGGIMNGQPVPVTSRSGDGPKKKGIDRANIAAFMTVEDAEAKWGPNHGRLKGPMGKPPGWFRFEWLSFGPVPPEEPEG